MLYRNDRQVPLKKQRNVLCKCVASLGLLAVALGIIGCGSSSKTATIRLVAYSTPQEAYEQIIPAFKKTAVGKQVSFTQSYGPSGDQSRAVAAGLQADVVTLSLAPDVNKLVKAGKVNPNWNQDSFAGFVTNSVVVFAVRKGNPKNIRTWDDLIKPGVEVLEPNPFTSGSAKWNIMAAYGAQLKQGKTPAQAEKYILQLLKNVPVQNKSAREAMQTFTSGKGDVLLAYENEAITAQQKGQAVEYVIPDATILIQNPITITANSKNAKQAKAFVQFTRTETAQKIFQEKGYRPVIEKLVDPKRFPTPTKLFTIDDLGGWKKINDSFFDPDAGSIAKIQKQLGQPTSK